jgi:hypothetical protein
MSLIEIKKVESKKDLKTFIDFHYDLYEGNEYDVPNLFSDEMNTRTGTHMLHIAQVSDIVVGIFHRLLLLWGFQFIIIF